MNNIGSWLFHSYTGRDHHPDICEKVGKALCAPQRTAFGGRFEVWSDNVFAYKVAPLIVRVFAGIAAIFGFPISLIGSFLISRSKSHRFTYELVKKAAQNSASLSTPRSTPVRETFYNGMKKTEEFSLTKISSETQVTAVPQQPTTFVIEQQTEGLQETSAPLGSVSVASQGDSKEVIEEGYERDDSDVIHVRGSSGCGDFSAKLSRRQSTILLERADDFNNEVAKIEGSDENTWNQEVKEHARRMEQEKIWEAKKKAEKEAAQAHAKKIEEDRIADAKRKAEWEAGKKVTSNKGPQVKELQKGNESKAEDPKQKNQTSQAPKDDIPLNVLLSTAMLTRRKSMTGDFVKQVEDAKKNDKEDINEVKKLEVDKSERHKSGK